MRYWIWWNDLIQGPFELEEVTSLKAFSEDLLVCMEDREDWLPASRVADLSSAIEQLRARKAAPLVPPPPPPKRPPAVTPLQGEFFGEASEQQSFLEPDDGPKGPLAYRPIAAEPDVPSYFIGQATMPFHFVHRPPMMTPVIEMPRPQPSRITLAPPPVIKESPIPQPEEEPIIEAPPKMVLKKAAIPIEILTDKPSLAPPMEEPAPSYQKPAWLPWIFGVVLALGAIGSAGYWVMDKASTHSAIAAANRMNPINPDTIPQGSPLPVASPLPMPVPPVKDSNYSKVSSRMKKSIAHSKTAVRKAKVQVRQAIRDTSAIIPKVLHKSPVSPDPVPAAPIEPIAPTQPESVSAPVLPGIAQETLPKPAAPPLSIESHKSDVWYGKQNDAIGLVLNKTLPKSKVTVGNQARAMLQEMHEKELLHAAETGERLYLPDKLAWAALQEEGSHYRVYLNFLAWQANGERLQSRSYQFLVDLARKEVRTEDPATQQDLLTQPAELHFKHNPMAVDIESILGGVDHYNKQKMRGIIVKNNRRNKNEQKNIIAGVEAAKTKVIRAVVYFRKAYSTKALENVAKAYAFSDMLK